MAVTGADPPSTAAPLLLFVGRIQPLKGADVAVRTLAELPHPDARLVVVGGPSGPDGEAELARVHGLVDELGLTGRVTFVAPRPHEELTAYYRAADVCLVPSRSESFGLVALEAAACGTPVVAAAVGGLATLVVPGITGFLVDGRDPADYAAYVAKLLDDPELAALVGRPGRGPRPPLPLVDRRRPPAPALRRPHRPPPGRVLLTRAAGARPPRVVSPPVPPPRPAAGLTARTPGFRVVRWFLLAFHQEDALPSGRGPRCESGARSGKCGCP